MIMKKGPLSKAEKAFIEENLAGEMSVESMAENMNRSVSMVQKHVDKVGLQEPAEEPAEEPVESVEETAEEEPAVQQEAPVEVSDSIARREGVTIMTKEASMAADDSRKSRMPNSKGPARYDRFLHQIKE